MERKKKLTSTSNAGLLAYRKSIAEMSDKVKKFVLEVSEGNLLNAKLSLWGALQKVEEMLKERRL